METSDEEIVLQLVTNYCFVDQNGIPISFTLLPICMEEDKEPGAANIIVFLHGISANCGQQKVYKQVTSWRLRFEFEQLAISVLLEGGKWIELGSPRKSYEARYRTIMITLQWIHYVRRNPEALGKSIWDHLCRVFSSFEERPSKADLVAHLINQFTRRDEIFKDVVSNSFSRKQYFSCDDEVCEGAEDADINEEEPGLFDSVCAICDNGGEILCCEGRCLRSFHATKEAGLDSQCKTLGYSRTQVEALQNFVCKNCFNKQHQCFACGQLGSSDIAAGAEVFCCVSATCGYFYHPKCVAHLLFPENETEAQMFHKKVASGESFICPIHRCLVCKGGENKEIFEMQFAICRRCPRAYHRKCLPRKISFEDSEGIFQRAWDGLLPNRILIYCLKHPIVEALATPVRNHIIFPEIPQKKMKIKVLQKLSKHQLSVKPHKLFKKLSGAEHSPYRIGGKTYTKQILQNMSPPKENMLSYLQNQSFKRKARSSVPAVSPSSTSQRYNSFFPVIDSETETRMKSLMDEVSFSLKRQDILKDRTVPSTHICLTGHTHKSITLGKVEGSVEAIRAALRKLDLQKQDGDTTNNIDDAKTVCDPRVLMEMMNWRKKLVVNLAPFIHGRRYTSYGRHFTKVDKLKEIVDKLHSYVQDGDTIVDFCCGANDFSRLMNEKLSSSGKNCSYRNYDIIQPKNDFNFEKRDWMTVQPGELPEGSKLIMGLNPPFGVQASLANKFIDKALTFGPKLIILIVPKETQRLDEKAPYDLIWEDQEKLSGKAFYLPGSVDVNDKQIEQWNVNAPPLYLWSHRDWTAKHKEISLTQCHSYPEPVNNKEDQDDLSDMIISPTRSECGGPSEVPEVSSVTHSFCAPSFDSGFLPTVHVNSVTGSSSMYLGASGATDTGFSPTYGHMSSIYGSSIYPPSIIQGGFYTGLPGFHSDYSHGPIGFTPGPHSVSFQPQPHLQGLPGFGPGLLPPHPDMDIGGGPAGWHG